MKSSSKSLIKKIPAKKIILPILTLWVMLGIWYAVVMGFQIHPFILPTPHEIILAGIREAPILLPATAITFLGALIGFLIAVIAGFLMSLLLFSSPFFRYSLYPFIIFMQMIPIIATAAIIVILFDVGLKSVVLITFLIGFFPIVAAGLQGLHATPKPQLELFQLYKASPLQTLFKLRIPYALPYYFTGIRIASTLAIIGAVTGEIFAGSTNNAGGLGFQIILFKSELKTDAIFAATLICCLLGYLFVLSTSLIKRKCLTPNLIKED